MRSFSKVDVGASILHLKQLTAQGNEPTLSTVMSRGLSLEVFEWPVVEPTRTPIVFVHGYLDNASAWFPLTNTLARSWPCISFSLAGHGRSDWAPTYQWIDFVFDLRMVIMRLTNRPVCLVAHSMGAHIASCLAYYYPDLVERLVVIDGFSPQRKAPDDYSVMRSLSDSLGRLDREATWPTRYGSFDEIFERRHELTPRIPREVLRPIVENGTVQTNLGWTWSADYLLSDRYFPWESRFGRPVDVMSLWAATPKPTLLMSGGLEEASHLTPKRTIAWQAEQTIPHIRHSHFADCGHYLHLESSDRATAEIVEFLEQPHKKGT